MNLKTLVWRELFERKNQLAGTLSGGERQMLAIAKALMENNLIAFAQNGADIHPMNGAPLRLVVPVPSNSLDIPPATFANGLKNG